MIIPAEPIRHEFRRRELRVARTATLTPGIVRVTLEGAELEGFSAPGPGDHVKVLVPAGGETVGRDLTPAAFRATPGGGELDLDIVLHETGPLSDWTRAAAPGSPLTVGGPRGSRPIPTGIERLVLAVDATAYPAAARWIRAAPSAAEVVVLAFSLLPFADYLTATASDAPDAAADGPVEIRAVQAGDGALSALRELAAPSEGTLYVLAGEAGALVPLRRHLRRELGLPPEQLRASGYWRLGISGHDHHAPVDPDDPD